MISIQESEFKRVMQNKFVIIEDNLINRTEILDKYYLYDEYETNIYNSYENEYNDNII